VLFRSRDVIDAGLQAQISRVTDSSTSSATTVVRRITALDSPEIEADKETLQKQPIAAFCGLGNPNAFFQQLREEGFDLRHAEPFHDHHKYSQTDIDVLSTRAKASGAQALITTAKDAVKLRSMRFTLPVYILEIEMQIKKADELLALIDQAITAKRGRHRER